jgi:hypothetical protein
MSTGKRRSFTITLFVIACGIAIIILGTIATLIYFFPVYSIVTLIAAALSVLYYIKKKRLTFFSDLYDEIPYDERAEAEVKSRNTKENSLLVAFL